VEYLRVKNWDEFQQYKDRDPKWIKVHRDLLYDYEFDNLSERNQVHLLKIWLLAAKIDNKIPNDPVWVARHISAKSKVFLNQLCTAGFLVPYETVQDCTGTYLEEEAEEEVETEENTSKPLVSPCPHQKIIEIYHQVLPERPQVLLARWSGSQSETNLKARWREHEQHRDVDWWCGFFGSVRANDWWMGRDKWKGVDLHWLLKRTNFDKAVQNWANQA